MTLILPQKVRERIEASDHRSMHPGLLLDKYQDPSGNMARQKQALERVVQAVPDDAIVKAAAKRVLKLFTCLHASTFEAETTAPLTLHLARNGSFENAGVYLHSVYGCASIPGTSLKGMARAWAETRWLPAQEDQTEAWRIIGRVFGRNEASDLGKSWKPEGNFEETGAGDIIFHDAYPLAAPNLFVDVATNHHPEYYQGDQTPPADWESPTPLSFLAVQPQTTFIFGLSSRSKAENEYLDLATKWLQGTLVFAGAGAKTASGYGGFRIKSGASPTIPSSLEQYETELSLVTPAFLAGGQQDASDCDLRPSTLRGLLRWWWRSLHSNYLDLTGLKELEGLIWGDTNQGSPVRITVEAVGTQRKQKFQSSQIAKKESIRKPGGRTIMGLDYGSYGMNQSGTKEARYFLDAGTRWKLTLIARETSIRVGSEERIISAQDILKQAQAALWLLCRFGGVGSKARNGYGSFQDIKIDAVSNLEDCKECARDLRRKACAKKSQKVVAPNAPSLDLAIFAEKPLLADTAFKATHAVGQMMQDIKGVLPKADRALLGLPGKGRTGLHERHASPTIYHVIKTINGYSVRITAFPTSSLLSNDTDAMRAVTGLKTIVEGPPGTREKRRPSLVGAKGTCEGEGCVILKEDGDDLYVRFDYGDEEYIPRNEFIEG